jgi:ABC-type multidrug transport system ATPase subunit
LLYSFNLTALDALSFSVSRGEMVCVMGASGSGKSTLLRAIGGQLHPTEGQVLLNGQQLYSDLETLKRFVTYIPQDDAFDDYLTIEENMEFAAAIRSPHLSKRDRARRVGGGAREPRVRAAGRARAAGGGAGGVATARK